MLTVQRAYLRLLTQALDALLGGRWPIARWWM